MLYIYIYAHTYTHIYMYMYVYMYMYLYIHIYIHTYFYIHYMTEEQEGLPGSLRRARATRGSSARHPMFIGVLAVWTVLRGLGFTGGLRLSVWGSGFRF